METVKMLLSDTLHRGAETAPPSPYLPHLIGPDEVRAGIARELHSLADLGLPDADVLGQAVEITAAKIRNSSVLVEHQAHDGRCHVCGGPLDDSAPVVAVMQAKPGRPLFIHHGECCVEHSRRRTALVDAIMCAAGYGARTNRKAA